jgi:hypothetical protein
LYFGVDGRPRAGDALRAVERGVLRVVGARGHDGARGVVCGRGCRLSGANVRLKISETWND